LNIQVLRGSAAPDFRLGGRF